MTEIDLLTSPYRAIRKIIDSSCCDPLPEETVASLDKFTNLYQEFFSRSLKENSSANTKEGDIDYVTALIILNTTLKHYYSDLLPLLPVEIIDKLQNKLPYLPPAAPAVDWKRLVDVYLSFRSIIIKKALISKASELFIDEYIDIAFTVVLVRFTNNNIAYSKEDIDKEFLWIFEQCQQTDAMFGSLFRSALIESGDLDKVNEIRHHIEDVIQDIKYFGINPFHPKWAFEHPKEKVLENGEKQIQLLKDIEGRINEKQTRSSNASQSKSAQKLKTGESKPAYKRGDGYRKPNKEAAKIQFKNELKKIIQDAKRNNKNLNQEKAIDLAYKRVKSGTDIPIGSLGGYLSIPVRNELYSEIHKDFYGSI